MRRIKRSTSRVLRIASSSTRPTHSATALPPATAYGTPASSSALVALRNRSLTFSAAMSALSQPMSPAAGSAMIHVPFAAYCCLESHSSNARSNSAFAASVSRRPDLIRTRPRTGRSSPPRPHRLPPPPARPLVEQPLQIIPRRPPRLADEMLLQQRPNVMLPNHAQPELVELRHHEVTVPDLRL